jgi:NADH dehydrogenase
MPGEIHHVVIVGAGFGGLEAANGLSDDRVRVTLVDRRNHHLFQPLLYQAATALLAPSEVAWPIRHILRRRRNVTTILATVKGVDVAKRSVLLEECDPISYDTLVIATGARHAYFGHDEWAPFAPGLKMLEDATAIRGRILQALEEAEREPDPARRAAFMTYVIVGGGPTGVELAGTIAELARQNVRGDFRNIDTAAARIVLIEAGDRLLNGFDQSLGDYAKHALQKLGVEVVLQQAVNECDADGVRFGDHRLEAKVIIWAAGVRASPAAEWLGISSDRAGRAMIQSDLTVPDHPEIFVIGDATTINDRKGNPVPGVAPAAKQQGRHVANTILRRLSGSETRRPFRYRNYGSLATVGRNAAVIDFGWIKLKGGLAWWLWGLVHIYYLVNARNRFGVVLSWFWVYLTGVRSARLITQPGREPMA